MDLTNPNTSKLPSSPDKLVTSSAIEGYSYDAMTYQLTVWYKGKSSPIHRYFNVFPPMVSDIFDSAGSIGLKARMNLKGLQSQKLK